jgi:Flp pilus assembly protein TadD
MILQWFNARQASEAGAALADKVTSSAAGIKGADPARSDGAMLDILRRAGAEMGTLRLNFYQRAKLANAFKWRLIENGVEKKVADKVTQALVVDLSRSVPSEAQATTQSAPARRSSGSADELLAKANRLAEQGDYLESLDLYRQVLAVNPEHVAALNNTGSALVDLGRFIEGEQHFRRALSIDPNFVEAHCNLGDVLRKRGYFAESERSLRCAIKLRPNLIKAQASLGLTLTSLGRIHDARGRFRKVLKTKPRHLAALHGMGEIALKEGRWEEADKLFTQILEIDPRNAAALSARAGLRKMTPADAPWLAAVEQALASASGPPQEAALSFAIGKYYDDIGEYPRAFQSVKRANDLMRSAAEPYDQSIRNSGVEDLIRANTRDAVARAAANASDSTLPVFVVGMPRSGTSLVEQIIASHPLARGAGECDFWSEAMRNHETQVRHGVLDEGTRKELAETYVQTLTARLRSDPKERAEGPLYIVDKAPVNSDYLGVIHSVLPKARIVYARRDPLDTCLSCYFQDLPLTLNYAFDLSSLAHYYKGHQRLFAHWRSILPPGTILEVPYEELVADQEAWTRKILEFLELEWDSRCLNFDQTQRVVTTASYRQVRQKMYKTSVARWRNYEKFIGPLLSLR